MDTLDVRGLPKDKVSHLQRLIEQWREEPVAKQMQTPPTPKPIIKRKVNPDEFIVKKSNIIGEKVTRAMAYE